MPSRDGLDVAMVLGVASCGRGGRARVCASDELPSGSATRADAGPVAAADVDGEVLGDGDAVSDVLADGLDDGDVLDEGEVLGDGLDDCVGLGLADALADGELAAQLGVVCDGRLCADPLEPGPT